MISTQTLLDQTCQVRQRIAELIESFPADRTEAMPRGWRNNARWHAGHLVVTPRLLTLGLMREALDVPDDYRAWFAKGTSPADWAAGGVPPVGQLAAELVPTAEKMFRLFGSRMHAAFPEPYTTSAGVVLRSPAEALNFSLFHDGIHLGLLLALRRDVMLAQRGRMSAPASR